MVIFQSLALPVYEIRQVISSGPKVLGLPNGEAVHGAIYSIRSGLLGMLEAMVGRLNAPCLCSQIIV